MHFLLTNQKKSHKESEYYSAKLCSQKTYAFLWKMFTGHTDFFIQTSNDNIILGY